MLDIEAFETSLVPLFADDWLFNCFVSAKLASLTLLDMLDIEAFETSLAPLFAADSLFNWIVSCRLEASVLLVIPAFE